MSVTESKTRLRPRCAQDRRSRAEIVMTGVRDANIERQRVGQLEPVLWLTNVRVV